MKPPLETIRDLAKTARKVSLSKKYYGDVERELKEIEVIAKELIKFYKHDQ